ncbi:MAG TPA: bifunctional hydroxymethylpyrimidine kinase/phosphomethylpyrimidine kinase [Candidatus Angelobacter sp.]
MPSRKKQKPPIVLTIAGHDPSSGAGITADIKTIAAHGCYGVSCITALTVQSTRGVKRVQAVAGKVIADTLEELACDLEIAAVKIGMLGSSHAARAVARFLRRHRPKIIVLDTILRSTSGAELISRPAIAIMKNELLPAATVVTPNIDEAAALTGVRVKSKAEMRSAADSLRAAGAKATVITGGHLKSPVDLLSARAGKYVFLKGQKVQTNSTHGTGCAFSTALACNLARGKSLESAVRAAKRFVESALRHAPRVGRGRGPVI